MSNIVTEQLAEATFEGFRFRVRTESISRQGRRIILHEYLNSDRIFAEDIGEIPPHFTVDAFVHSDRVVVPGQVAFPNFLQKAEQFRNTLKQRRDKPGLLTLPTIGTFQAVVLEFSESSSQRSVGEVRFSITFIKAAGSIAPVEAAPVEANLFVVTDACRVQIQEVAIEKWNDFVLPDVLPDLDINSYLSALDTLSQLPTDISTRLNNTLNAGALGRIRDSIRNFKTSLPNILNLPNQLFGTLISAFEDTIGLFQAISNETSGDDAVNSFDLADTLCRSGSGLPIDMAVIRDGSSDPANSTIDSFDKPNWNETTIQREQRNDSRNLLLDVFRACWFVTLLEQAAINEYLTDLEIDAVRIRIEGLYNNAIDAERGNTKSFLSDNNVLSLIDQARRTALLILEQKEQQAYRVTTEQYNYTTSALNISYQLYAEELTSFADLEARADIIAGLNPDQRPDKMTGEIKVLQVR